MRYRITQTGVRITALTTTLTPTTLPLCDDGTTARHIRLMVEPTSNVIQYAYFHLGGASVTCSRADTVITSNEDAVIESRGFSYISVLSPVGTSYVNMVPLENG